MENVCPKCHSRLGRRAESLSCESCGASYPTLRGIPDLRTADDEYLPNADDWRIALALDAEYDGFDFLGLLHRYYDLMGDVPGPLRARQVAHILTAPARAAMWMEELGPSDGPILDLGCGPGGFLAARAGDGRSWVGVDIAMRWLILARKRLDEAGLNGVALVCGCAERLPFAEDSFTGIVGGDVIEHVRDQATTLAEASRVLRPGGRMILATPNRFSLAPEPHVGVWGVGYLPRRWMAPYVRLVRRVDFRAIHTLGVGEWERLTRQSGFASWRIVAPSLPEDLIAAFPPLKRALAWAYNLAVETRPGQALSKAIGPLFHLVAEKATAARSTPGASPAIRPRSTRSAATA